MQSLPAASFPGWRSFCGKRGRLAAWQKRWADKMAKRRRTPTLSTAVREFRRGSPTKRVIAPPSSGAYPHVPDCFANILIFQEHVFLIVAGSSLSQR